MIKVTSFESRHKRLVICLPAAALGGPLEVLELLTPVMSVTALLFSLAWEELWVVLPGSVYFSSLWHTSMTLLAIALGGIIAFLMVWTEYQVGEVERGKRLLTKQNT